MPEATAARRRATPRGHGPGKARGAARVVCLGVLLFVLILFAVTFGAVFYVLPLAALIAATRLAGRHVARLRAVSSGRPTLVEAAEHLSLRRVSTSRVRGDAYAGRVGSTWLELSQRPRPSMPGGALACLRITLNTEVRLPDRLELRSRVGDAHARLALPAAVRTCDPSFDRRFVTSGRPAGVAARLDAVLRQRLVALDDDLVLSIADEGLVAETRRPMPARTVVRLVGELAGVLEALADAGPQTEARLLTNGLTDPELAVRYQNLELLLREHPSTPEAREGLKLAWQAPERGIRFLAAIRGTSENATAFLEETVAREDEPVLLRTMSLEHLARRAPLERVRPLLHRMFTSEHSRLRAAAIALAGRLRDGASVNALLALGRRMPLSPAARAAIARALGAIGDERAEPRLLELLGDAEVDVKVAAATALGRAGSSRSLGPLGRVVSRYAAVRALSDAAASAVARIEVRVGPVERGRLSILDSSARGALAFPDAEPGALALASKADGQSL